MSEIARHKLTFATLTALVLLTFAAAQTGENPGRDEYLYARKLFEEKYYDLAAEQLERCLRDFPGLREADEAQFLLGEAYLKAGDSERARAAFLRTAIIYSESPRAPEALFKVGESLEIAGRSREAMQAFERVEGFYSGSQLAPSALWKASALGVASGDTGRADDIAGQIIEKYPDSPYAAMARLARAYRALNRSDYRTCEQYFRFVTSRAGVDSLSSAAWLGLGRLNIRRFNLNGAEEHFRKAIDLFPATPGGAVARLELADLYNTRGEYVAATEILAPLLAETASPNRSLALIKAGDAAYLAGDYESALVWFDSTAKTPEAALKAAWTAEMLSRRKSALDRYQKLTVGEGAISRDARIRAAILSVKLGSADKSAGLWQKIIERNEWPDSLGRALYELAAARSEARMEGVEAAIERMQSEYPSSPYTDDGLFLTAQAAFRRADYSGAVRLFGELIEAYPASVWRDSSLAAIQFINHFHLRGEKLIERMAELSSLPQNRTNPVRWALDWGDFYLDEFKDPVKAVDQFDRVLDDILATTDDRAYALYRSGVAYQLLAEAGMRDKDNLSWVMYSDSSRSRLMQLQKIEPQGNFTLRLGVRLFESDVRLVKLGALSPAIAARRFEDLLSRFGEDSLPTADAASYLDLRLQAGGLETADLNAIIAIAERVARRVPEALLLGELKLIQVKALKRLGQNAAAIDTARECVEAFPATPAAAELTSMLMNDAEAPPLFRYNYLQRFRRIYPYSVNPDEYFLTEANLLDKLDRPIEALAARRRAAAAAAWGRPALDILALPPTEIRFERAVAFRRAGVYPQAAEELSLILSLSPNGPLIPKAIYEYALVEKGRQNPQGALLYLDTLAQRFLGSPEELTARRLRPELLINLGDFVAAVHNIKSLRDSETRPDSLYDLGVRYIVMLHRLKKGDDAKKEATELFKRFKDRIDLDDARALFVLEKGRSFEADRKFKEAREQYNIVREKHLTSKWADDAAFAFASSFVAETKLEEAMANLTRFIADYPASEQIYPAWLSLGLVQFQLEKYSEAVASLKKVWEAQQAEPLWQRTFEALSTVYRNLRFFDAAIRLNRDYLTRFPDAPDHLDRRMDIAQFYLQLQEWDEAIRQYRPLLPLADAEREAEIQYYIGEANLGKGDYRTAILEFLKVKILGRKTKLDWGVTAIYQAGFCYEKLGDYPGASRMYRRIIQETGAESNYGRAAQQKLDSLPVKPDTNPTPPAGG